MNNENQSSSDEEKNSTKLNSKEKNDSNDQGKKKNDEYNKFKIYLEQLLEDDIPVNLKKYDFKELRTNKEAKKAGMNEVLDGIDGKFKNK